MLALLMNLGFAGSGADAPVVETPAATTGGGKSRRRSRYPRKVVVDGVVHVVNSPEEERRLLQALFERAQDAAQVAEGLGDTQLAQQIQKRAVRIRKRVEAVDNREQEWLQRLMDEDEEILVLLQ